MLDIEHRRIVILHTFQGHQFFSNKVKSPVGGLLGPQVGRQVTHIKKGSR